MSQTLRVQPLADGVAMRGNWQVTKAGVQESTHTQKTAALSAARQAASTGDTIVVHGTGGEVQRSFEPQASSRTSSTGQSASGSMPDPGVELDDGLNDDFSDLNDLLD